MNLFTVSLVVRGMPFLVRQGAPLGVPDRARFGEVERPTSASVESGPLESNSPCARKHGGAVAWIHRAQGHVEVIEIQQCLGKGGSCAHAEETLVLVPPGSGSRSVKAAECRESRESQVREPKEDTSTT